MAPYFVNGDGKGSSFPWTNGSTSNCIVWKGSQWSAGANNQYPKASTTVSSFEVLDQLIRYFDNTTMFPNMKQIVIAGHSLGGQTVARYAEIGNVFETKSKVTYWIGNPNSYAWLSAGRPIASLISSCPTYDNYRDGFNNFTQYPMSYAASLVASGRDAIVARWNSRSKAFARGMLDFGDDSSNCNPYTIGANRNERFFNLVKQFPPSCPDPTGQTGSCDTVDYINAGHDAGQMFADPAGRARLFTDNFYGNGSRAFDFGYPRLQLGDDPWPNPTWQNTSISTVYSTTQTYSGKWSYQGCWTDEVVNNQALPYLAYDNSSNTAELCMSVCSELGYSIAGVGYTSHCYCGNVLSAFSEQTVEQGCTIACPGNSDEVCGNNWRLNIFSINSTLEQNAQPVVPPTVINYAYYGCMTEPASGRALTNSTYGDGTNMTIESCASFCQGHVYFGLEYANQCYCGDSLDMTVVNKTLDSDCNMLCSGNSSELCGGPNRLTTYKMAYELPKPAAPKPETKTETLSISSSTPISTLSTTTKPSHAPTPTWNTHCKAPCKAPHCASYRPKVLSYCTAHSTGYATTITNTHSITITTTKTLKGKIATVHDGAKHVVTKAPAHKKAKGKGKKTAKIAARKVTKKAKKNLATCSSALPIMKGYNCQQVQSLCDCLVPKTGTTTRVVEQVVATSVVSFWPKVSSFSFPFSSLSFAVRRF